MSPINRATIAGTVILVGPVEVKGAKGFRIRQIVVETAEAGARRPCPVPLKLTGDKVEWGEDVQPGSQVRCDCTARGSFWEAGKRYFLDLEIDDMTIVGEDPAPAPTPEPEPVLPRGTPRVAPLPVADDDCPF